MRVPTLVMLGALLAGCATPQLDVPDAAAIARQDYPRLQPIGRIMARTDAQPVQISPATTENLQARARALQARAALLRRDALTPGDRARLRAALSRLRAAQRAG